MGRHNEFHSFRWVDTDTVEVGKGSRLPGSEIETGIDEQPLLVPNVHKDTFAISWPKDRDLDLVFLGR